MKGRALLLVMLLMALGISPAPAQESLPALYSARLNKQVDVLSLPEGEKIGSIPQSIPIEILRVAPDWLLVRGNLVTGYIQRKYVDDTRVKPIDPARTPQYPAIVALYLGWTGQETPVRAAPGSQAEQLILLQPGARLAFTGLADGWAQLIFHRQYGYVDTRQLSELLPIPQDALTAEAQAPIAAFTSFYNISQDEVNRSRMVNIRVGCERFQPLLIAPEGRFDFNAQIGPYRKSSGYEPAFVLIDGQSVLGYGGGTCQVSSTLYNALLQLPGLQITARRPHGPGGAKYLPLHADAAVGNSALNLAFLNHYDFPVRIDGTAQDGALTIAIYRADQ
ncbi:MAG: VanW family protein [Christensenellales bacterium]